MRPRLSLRLLGSPQLHMNNKPVTLDRRKAVALLAYLAVERVTHSRDSLSALFWPDYDQSKAFANLRHILWELQQTLGEGWIIADRETMGIDPQGDLALDVRDFEELTAQSQAIEDPSLRISLLKDAAQLYGSHFLTGFSLKDAPNFNEWAFAKSEGLRHQLSRVLETLANDHSALGQADQAIPYARRLIMLDPLNEASHRLLMEIFLADGQQAAALKQYQACEQLLRKELNLDPQPETRELYKKIRRGDVKPVTVEEPAEPSLSRHNLPLRLSSFIGRKKQQEDIANLLRKNRLVTLVGAGGIGKTRLSLQMGQNLLGHYGDGVWFIALDALSDPALLPQTVAAIFGFQEHSDRSLQQRLMDFLHEKSALLIFDNCEHLLEACVSLITALLQSGTKLRILATSRETLNIPGEATYFMPALSLPESQGATENLNEYEAIHLFTERAGLALTSFALTDENAPAVIEICRKVDGIPLAIELAAARVNILQVEEIARQLDHSFALLSSDSRVILPRQQTLAASLDWSWGLLEESEQRFLRQLSVFAGGWTLESAREVCEAGTSIELVGLIQALVKKSLIVVEQETGRETRYRFHEIVRQYAHEKFFETDEVNHIRSRHLQFFLRLAKQAESELRSLARVDSMERLNEERNNLRAALHWADHTNIEAGLYLSGRLLRYWESFDLGEGISWLENFIRKPESSDFLLAKAGALHTYGWLLTWLQRFPQARAVTEEALTLFRLIKDSPGEIDSLISLANIAQFMDNLDLGDELLHEAMALSQSMGDRWRQGVIHGYFGWDRRDQQKAFIHWEKGIQLYREVGDQISLANLLSLLSLFRILNGDIDLGEEYLEEATRLWNSNKRANIWEHPKVTKSMILMVRGDYEQAYALLAAALQRAEESGNRMSYLWIRVRQAYVAQRAGNLEKAQDIFVETVSGFHADKNTVGVIFSLEGMADLFVSLGRPGSAARLIGWADALRKKIKDTRPNLEQADVDKVITACLQKIGEVAFSNAYDQGQSLSIDEAVALALDQQQQREKP